MALNALSHCVSRVLLANQIDESTLKADWDVMRSLAALGMEERHKACVVVFDLCPYPA